MIGNESPEAICSIARAAPGLKIHIGNMHAKLILCRYTPPPAANQ